TQNATSAVKKDSEAIRAFLPVSRQSILIGRILLREEVRDEAFAVVGEDGLRVELDAFDGQGLVAEAHDGAGVGCAAAGGHACGDLEFLWDRVFADDQRVVTRAGHGLREVAEDAAIIVLDRRGLAVHELGGTDDLGTEGRADGLMAEADAEGGDLLVGRQRGEALDERDEDAGVLRCAGAGREDDSRGAQGDNFVGGDLVVAFDDDLALTQFADVLDEVVGEGVVVVEDEDHRCLHCMRWATVRVVREVLLNMWSTDTKRMKHFAAMVLIGDGVMALVQPRRDARAWKKGPKLWRGSMQWLAKRPALARAIGAAQIAGGVLWALYGDEE